ncbi:MAG: transposase [Armatimonadetes bacterium]|nr:transposase [Armatimonadota bacterium]
MPTTRAAKSTKSGRVGDKKAKGKSHGNRWSDEVRADALSQLLQGIKPADVAKNTGVPDQTISDWAKKLGTIDALREGRIGDLVYEHLTESLETLAAISRHARQSKWLDGQDAPGLAIFYGVTSDKAVRLLAAIERARPADEIPTE